MIPLQIVINKKDFSISSAFDHRELVTNIPRMEDALTIFKELTQTGSTPGKENDWMVIPGILGPNG